MALPTQKRSKRRQRIKQYRLRLKKINLSKCPKCKKPVRPHNICSFCGTYKGMQMIKIKSDKKDKKGKGKEKKEKEKEKKEKDK